LNEKPKVYVPQEPSRYDAAFNARVPTVDLRPATLFGDVTVMLPSNVTGMLMAPIVTALKEKLAAFSDQDFLVAIGDPSIIAAASGIVLKKNGRMKMLKWDKRIKAYAVVEIEL